MKAVVTIQMDNQAFDKPFTCMELERILTRIADTVGRQAIDSVGHECTEADSNGNFIAKLEIVEYTDATIAIFQVLCWISR